MNESPIFSFALPTHEITESVSEQVGDDNPLAVEVAKPLFDAGIFFAALTERPEYQRTEALAHPWHTFYLVIQGEFRMDSGGTKKILQPGDMAFCPAGVSHLRTGLPGRPLRWIYIRLKDTPAWEPLKQRGFYFRSYESADLLFLLLRRILDAHRYRDTEQMAVAHYHARALAGLLRQQLRLTGRPPHSYTDAQQQLMTDIQESPGTDWSSARLAERLNVSTRKLYRIFSTEYGMPPKQMIIRARIAEAARQLTQTRTSVTEIAESLGYQSLYSFSNLFKKHTGLRPSAYRKQFR